MTESDLRNKVVQIASDWLGVIEGSAQHRQIIDVYNSYSPLPRGYKMTTSAAWCAAGASAVAIKAGLGGTCIPIECSCNNLIAMFQAMGRWCENDAYIPGPGDYLFYDWQDSGTGDNKGQADHVGIVERVTGNTIMVIEFNRSAKPRDMVGRRTMAVNGKFIRGYGLPDYAKFAESTMSEAERIVQWGVNDGVINSPSYWVSVIEGKSNPDGQYVQALIQRYHEKLVAAKGSK